MESFKKNKGITLVALIVTIIILLILAGITINALMGENGLIIKAILAKQQYEDSKNTENEILNSLYSGIYVATNDGGEVTLKLEELNKIIDERVEAKIETLEQEYNTLENKYNNLKSTTDTINSQLATIGKVELGTIKEASAFNIDTINSSQGYIYRVTARGNALGTQPTDIVSGNAYILIGFSSCSDTGLAYGTQIAIGFGSSKIAIRNCNFNDSYIGTWSSWKAIE